MVKMISRINKIDKIYSLGRQYTESQHHIDSEEKSTFEKKKRPFRFDLINYIIKYLNKEVKYLEIGVRRPEENFDKIKATFKYSVDPGFVNKLNPVQYKMTSDEFFSKLREGEILDSNIKFDIIFIDGLHLADQVERDIYNALDYIEDEGFIVLHDCNPPTEFHARESYDYNLSPSKDLWNGTTWKAFFKIRQLREYYSCCVDSDWGIGVISKTINLGEPTQVENKYFEYKIFEQNRNQSLNLVSFKEFQSLLVKSQL